MLKRFNRQLLWFILALSLLSSCTQPVTNDFPPYGSQPVVNSILVAGKPLEVHLSMSGGLDTFRLPTGQEK